MSSKDDQDRKRYETLKRLEFEHIVFGIGPVGDCRFCKKERLLLVNWPAYGIINGDDKDWIMCATCANILDQFSTGKKYDSSLD